MKLSEALIPCFEEDGKDHIRVSPTAKTLVGRMLAQNYNYPFFIPGIGSFLSPVCFANWMYTGDESYRHDGKKKPKGKIRNYREYVLYAKFFQLCKIKPSLGKIDATLPFISYRVYKTGITELDKWPEYTEFAKDMLLHIHQKGAKEPYPFPRNTSRAVDDRLAEIAKVQGNKIKPESSSQKPSEGSTEALEVNETKDTCSPLNLSETILEGSEDAINLTEKETVND